MREDKIGMSFFDSQVSGKYKSLVGSWNVLIMLLYLFLIEQTFKVAALNGDVGRLWGMYIWDSL